MPTDGMIMLVHANMPTDGRIIMLVHEALYGNSRMPYK